jgi:hypothetical protein
MKKSKSLLARMTSAGLAKNRTHASGWELSQGGHARRRPELKLAGGYAEPLKGAKQGNRVRLHVEGIVMGIEGSPRQKPNAVVQVEKISRIKG